MKTRTTTASDGSAFLIVEPEGGWAEVGDDNGDDGVRRRHWFACEGFAVAAIFEAERCIAQPFLTFAQVREAMVSGRYQHARQGEENTQRRADELRMPDRIIQGARSLRADDPMTGLNWFEASAFSRLLGGRLPTEKEADVLVGMTEVRLETPCDVWTGSPWSPWSYALCRWDQRGQRWIAPTDRDLPIETDDGSGQRAAAAQDSTVFHAGPKPTRRPASSAETQADMHTWIVFDVSMATR